MAPLQIAVLMWVVAWSLGAAAMILGLVFRRPGKRILEVGVWSFTILRSPQEYIRDPYARIVQALSIAALALFAITIASVVLFQLLR
jgi:hypothetical protein